MARAKPAPARAPTNALVAAAKRVNLNDKAAGARASRNRQPWQEEAWGYFDDVPEVKYATQWLGNQLSKLRLYIATVPDGQDQPIEADETSGVDVGLVAAAKAELARVQSPQGGQGEILRQMNMNLEIAGECSIVGIEGSEGTPDPSNPAVMVGVRAEEWDVKSVDELVVSGDGTYLLKASPSDDKPVTLYGTKEGVEPPPKALPAIVVRVWQRHPRWSQLADCAMRGVLGDCDTLLILKRQMRAEGRSRMNAGILLVPNELSFGSTKPTDEQTDGESEEDPFNAELMDALVTPISDEGAASAVVPTTMRGDADTLDKVRHIKLDRPADATLDGRVLARVQTIARGLNIPYEIVIGHTETTYANAGVIKQDEFDAHIQPRAVLLCDAWTSGLLRPALQGLFPDREDEIAKLMVWYDPSAIVEHPDQAADAHDAYQDGAISEEARRKYLGYGEDDAPSDDEKLLRIVMRGTRMDPFIVAQILKRTIMPEIQIPDPTSGGIEAGGQPTLPPAPKALPPAPTPTPEPPAVAGAGSRLNGRRALTAHPSAGRRLVAIDRDLRTKLLTRSNDALARALERAGAKLRSKAGSTRDVLRNVPNRMAAATLGPTLVAAAGYADPADLIDDSFDQMEDEFYLWGTAAQASALRVLHDVVGQFDPATEATIAATQAGDLADAWAWLRATLTRLAHQRLFDPNPSDLLPGEGYAVGTVPPGLIRQAVARAGGATGLSSDDTGGAWLALINGDTAPAGGIGTGQTVMEALATSGGTVEGYVWDYGSSSNPFPPHEDLDGLGFTNFDDAVLLNDNDFPDTEFLMPGDHDGCSCDVVPEILGPPDQTEA